VRRLRRLLVNDNVRLARRGAEVRRQVALVGERVALAPARGLPQRHQCAVDVVLAGTQYAEERAVADHLDAGRGPVVGERGQGRGRRRRPEHAPVEQPLGPQVGQEPGSTEHLVGDVEARHVRPDHGSRGHRIGVQGGQVDAGVEPGDPGQVRRVVTVGRRPGQIADRGSDVPQGRGRLEDRQAAGGGALVGAVGAGGPDADQVERQAERVRRDLVQGGEDALAELDLADVDVDPAVPDGDPRAQAWVGHHVGGQRALLGGTHTLTDPAASTASTIRWWVPHRQR